MKICLIFISNDFSSKYKPIEFLSLLIHLILIDNSINKLVYLFDCFEVSTINESKLIEGLLKFHKSEQNQKLKQQINNEYLIFSSDQMKKIQPDKNLVPWILVIIKLLSQLNLKNFNFKIEKTINKSNPYPISFLYLIIEITEKIENIEVIEEFIIKLNEKLSCNAVIGPQIILKYNEQEKQILKIEEKLKIE